MMIPIASTTKDAGHPSMTLPNRILRVAVAVGPARSAVWTIRPSGVDRPIGVTVDLADALASRLALPLELVEMGSSGEIVETADADRWDVSFVPVDEERRRRLLIGPAYHAGESTFLVREESPFVAVADVDRPGARVVGVENTATLRSARRFLQSAEVSERVTLHEALAEFQAGRFDALALGKDSLVSILPDLPGTRMTEGFYHQAETAVAVPRGKNALLAAVTSEMEELYRMGTIRAILARHLPTQG